MWVVGVSLCSLVHKGKYLLSVSHFYCCELEYFLCLRCAVCSVCFCYKADCPSLDAIYFLFVFVTKLYMTVYDMYIVHEWEYHCPVYSESRFVC